MRGEVGPDRIIAAIAERQGGVAARRQLVAAGLTHRQIDRRIASGRLHVLFRGVYAVGHRVVGALGRWWAAVLACGDDAVPSRFSAGHAGQMRASAAGRPRPGSGRTARRAVRGRDRPSAGRVRDFFWPEVPLVVEADSFRRHRSPSRLSDDRARDASLTIAGIPFARFTYEQVVEDPAYVVRTLRAMLGSTSPPMRW